MVLGDDVLVGPHAQAQILPPGAHEEIWPVQEGLDFPGTVYGLPREASARERMERQVAWFAAPRDDRVADQ